MLLNVLLVTTSSRGHQVAFRYPVDVVRPELNAPYRRNNGNGATVHFSSPQRQKNFYAAKTLPSSPPLPFDKQSLRLHNRNLSNSSDFLNEPPSVLSSSIIPNSGSTSVHAPSSIPVGSNTLITTAIDRSSIGTPSGNKPTFVTAKSVSNPNGVEWLTGNILGFHSSLLANILSPKASLCNAKFQLTVDSITFVGHPILLTSNERQGLEGPFSSLWDSLHQSPDEDAYSQKAPHINTTSTSTTSKTHSLPSIHMFHLVFALLNGADTDTYADFLYHSVISKVSRGLKYEELRCQYVRKQVDGIMQLLDDIASGGLHAPTPQDQMNALIAHSSLANELSALFEALEKQEDGHLLLNQFLEISFKSSSLHASKKIHYSSDNNMSRMQPYHTLLFLEDPNELIRSFPMDFSPALLAFIQIATPTQCFEDMRILLDCSLAQIYRLATHLVLWGKAKVIDVISSKNIYVVSPTPSSFSPQAHQIEFQTTFPDHQLMTILSQLSFPRMYSSIIPSKDQRALYLEMLIFLIKHNLVKQLHTFVYLVIPHHLDVTSPNHSGDIYKQKPISTNSLESLPNPTNYNPHSSFSISATATKFSKVTSGSAIEPWQMKLPLGQAENEWIRSIATSQPPPYSTTFQKLIQHFDGTHHLEEISFKENISMKDLKKILNRYRKFLITVHHF